MGLRLCNEPVIDLVGKVGATQRCELSQSARIVKNAKIIMMYGHAVVMMLENV